MKMMLELSVFLTAFMCFLAIAPAVGDLTGQKYAIYIRRSEGEKGSTKKQLDRIKGSISELEEATGRTIDRRIVGKDIDKKRRFDQKKDLVILDEDGNETFRKEGDIFNEGEGASGFKINSRPVFKELVRRVENGEYDGIAVESFDRISRDMNGLSHFALPLWREDGKTILGFDGSYLNDNLPNEFLLGITSNAASLTKAQEIAKSKIGRAEAIDLGFIKAGRPEFIGSGTKAAGLDYREAYRLMKKNGENNRGGLNKPGDVAKAMGKTNKRGLGENKWASQWYLKMKEYERLGILEAWLTAYERFNQFIVDQGGYPGVKWRSDKRVARVKKATAGFFAYPAGIKVEATQEFVTFPNVASLDLDVLADLEDPREYPDKAFKVRRVKTIPKNLSEVQIQGRSRVAGNR